jgi:polygalacturonase
MQLNRSLAKIAKTILWVVILAVPAVISVVFLVRDGSPGATVTSASVKAGERVAGMAEIAAEVKKYTSDLPFPMPEIRLPAIPDRVCSIADYGAVGDSLTMNTEAIAKAINDCADKGGGRVTVPAGTWLTGPIALKSNIDLHLESGSSLSFSRNLQDYGFDVKQKKPDFARLITGSGLHDVAITGDGIINGSRDAWRPVKRFKLTPSQWSKLVKSGGFADEDTWWPYPEGKSLGNLDKRPELILLEKCTSVLVDGVTLVNSPFYALHVNKSEQAVIRRVKVNNDPSVQNGDGFDIRESKNVVIYQNTITAGDDGMAIGAGGTFKPGAPAATQNIVLADNTVFKGHAGFAIGSVVRQGVKNVSVRNETFIGTDTGLRFKSSIDRGNVVEGIYIENIRMKDIVNEAILFDMHYDHIGEGIVTPPAGALVPQYRNIRISNVTVDGAAQAVRMDGLAFMPLENIEMSDMILSAKSGFTANEAKNVRLRNVQVIPAAGPAFKLKDCLDFTLDRTPIPKGADTFIAIQGARSSGLQLLNTDTSALVQPFVFEEGASVAALTRK